MAKASDFEGKKQDELFYFVEYSPEEAERIGYSNYSYWGSVIQNFLKQKVAVFCLILFLALTVFSFIALAIGKYRLHGPDLGYEQGVHQAEQRILVRHRQPWPRLLVPSVVRHAGVHPSGSGRRRWREHRRRHLWPDLGLCPQLGPLLHGAVQPDR